MQIERTLLAATALSLAVPAYAQNGRIDALERQLAAQQQRIDQLEALVTKQAGLLPQITAPASSATPTQSAVAAPAADGTFRAAGLDVSGDMRVRQEWNFVDGRDRSRTAVRARLRAAYAVSDTFSVGAQIATGDPDDPNSADVTLGNFVDDFAVSLDQAWIRYRSGGLTSHAGKFPQIFQRTDMLWDSDVSPDGPPILWTRV